MQQEPQSRAKAATEQVQEVSEETTMMVYIQRVVISNM